MSSRSLNLFLFLALCVSASAQALQGLAGGDEFVGPFASWANIKTYGALGDGVADDSAAFQAALNDIGNPGRPLILYLPAGTYKITKTLVLSTRRNVGIIGENPTNTIVRWAGALGGEMLGLNGVPYSRFGRITWDGAGKALAAIDQSWTGGGNFGGSSYVEHADEIFQDASYGIRGGSGGLQDGETAILRCRFLRMTKAGVSIENYNALDWYIWDSTFDSNYLGVTNIYGAGNFQVYSSLFKNSSRADVEISATSYFALRNNFSIGSKAFFVTSAIGNPAAPATFQKNTILDAQTTPIQFGNPGPVLMLDNVIRSASGQTGPVVSIAEAYTDQPTARLVAIGNTYTVASPYAVQGNLMNIDDTITTRAAVNPSIPVMPAAPASYNRKVFEVPAGADTGTIQTAINSAVAVNQRAVVHLAPSTYNIGQTLIIPANADVQLVGDNASNVGGTQLRWAGNGAGPVLRIVGPSRAILRDFSVIGNGSSIGIQADNVDQTGSRIFTQQFQIEHGQQAGVLVNGLENADVSFQNAYIASNVFGLKVVGGPNAAQGPVAARVGVYAGFSGDNGLTYGVSSFGQLNVQDVWYEGAPPNFLQLTDSGSFTLDGGLISAQDPNHNGVVSASPSISVSGFKGNVTLVNSILHSRNRIAIDSTTANVLGLGLVGPPDNANYFTVTNSPSARTALLNSRQLTATGGSTPVADQVSNVAGNAAFVKQMLASLRTVQPHAMTDVPSGATDLRLYRIALDNHLVGASFQPGSTSQTNISTFITGQALTSPIRNQFGGWIGMRFTVGSTAMAVSSLGRMCVAGNSGQHVLKLVQGSGGDVSGGSATVNMAACVPGQYAYATLASPVSLAAGATYLLVSQESAGGDFWYDFGQVTPSGGTVVGCTYGDGTSFANIAQPNTSYGPLNFVYQTGVVVAPPPPPPPPPPPGPTPTTATPFITAQTVSSPIRNSFSGWIGMQFKVGSAALTIDSLGRYCVAGNSANHVLKLVAAGSSADVAGGSVSVSMVGCTPGQYVYGALSTPLSLTAGATYLLMTQEVSGGDSWYDFGPVTGASVASILGCTYGSGSSYTSVGMANAAYGPVNFLYEGSAPVTNPPPTNVTPFVASQALTSAVHNTFSGWIGMSFTVGSTPISVASLGRMCVAGNSAPHAMKLVQTLTGADVSGSAVTVSMTGCTPGQYVYTALPSAVTLAAGSAYLLVSLEVANGDGWYDFGNVTSTKAGIIVGSTYSSGANFVPVPLPNTSYGPVNFQYK